MEYATYERLENDLTPSIVRVGEKSTPVWRQNRWENGEFAVYRANGCGHCCTAMAARMNGVKDIDPQKEFELCRKLWGPPNEKQNNAITICGIDKILTELNVPHKSYGVFDKDDALENIVSALSEGKQVIFNSVPTEENPYPKNPFSKGGHYVMAVGFAENGRIMVANSSERWTEEGVQFVEPETIKNALFLGGEPMWELTWGGAEYLERGRGYIIVG